MYNNYNYGNYKSYRNYGDDRFFFTPFVVGGLAGTALGMGIANNNQIKNMPYQYYPIPYPYYQPVYPVCPCNNNNY